MPIPVLAMEDFARVRDLVLSEKIRPVLAGTRPIEALAHAQADFVGKDFIGKLVITMDSPLPMKCCAK